MNDDLQQVCNKITVARQMFNPGPHTENLSAGIDKMLDFIQNAEKGRTKLVEPVQRLYGSLLHPMSLAGKGAEIRFDELMRDRVESLASDLNTIFDRGQPPGPIPAEHPIADEHCEVGAAQLSGALDKFGGTESMSAIRFKENTGVVLLRQNSAATPNSLEKEGFENNEGLPLTPEEILADCPRFRILVIGKSGTGKSTLINQTFNVKLPTTADYKPGQSDINKEITSDDNQRFILHDSMGFEAGELKNLSTVTDFIRKRNLMPDLRDKIHAVWLCLPIPYAGGRLLETGDEKFLELDFGLPVIAVFTKLDIIQGKEERTMKQRHNDWSRWSKEERQSCLNKEVDAVCEVRCATPLRKVLSRDVPYAAVSMYNPERLEKLVQLTSEYAEKCVGETVALAWAVAQRANVDVNVEGSIRIGGKSYWRGLSSSFFFREKRLNECLDAIHDGIVKVWNFLDPHVYLHGDRFKASMLYHVKDLGESGATSPSGTPAWHNPLVGAVALYATAPILATLAGGAAAVRWLLDIYSSTPGILRVLMGYIIDLTAVLECLFLLIQTQRGIGPRKLSLEIIDLALSAYDTSTNKAQCHLAIKEFVQDKSIFQLGQRDMVLEEITRLIHRHRFQPDKDLKQRAAQLCQTVS